MRVFSAGGNALLILLPSEVKFAEKLQAARIPIEKAPTASSAFLLPSVCNDLFICLSCRVRR
jgi:hypothetical protein